VTVPVEDHVVASACKQARLASILGEDESWTADIDTGVLTIGPYTFSAEVAGSAAQGTFLWGWDHPSVPPERASLARRIHSRAAGVPELSEAEVVLDPVAAAIVSVGLADADAWWFGEAGEATVLFLIADEQLARVPYTLFPLPLLISELTGALAFDHRRAFERFAAAPLPGIEVVSEGDGMRLCCGEDRVSVRFDDLGRITELTAE
jgi:uncharacterized protein DUF6882